MDSFGSDWRFGRYVFIFHYEKGLLFFYYFHVSYITCSFLLTGNSIIDIHTQKQASNSRIDVTKAGDATGGGGLDIEILWHGNK